MQKEKIKLKEQATVHGLVHPIAWQAIFCQSYVRIRQQEWMWNKLSSIIKMIERWEATHLDLHVKSDALKSIQHVGFPNLICLNVHQSELTSIEVLNRVQLPVMKFLDLSTNYLTQIRGIRKGRWPALQSLIIYENCFAEGNCLTEINAPALDVILIQPEFGIGKKSYSFYDISWGVKMNSLQLSKFGVMFRLRIKASFLGHLRKWGNRIFERG